MAGTVNRCGSWLSPQMRAYKVRDSILLLSTQHGEGTLTTIPDQSGANLFYQCLEQSHIITNSQSHETVVFFFYPIYHNGMTHLTKVSDSVQNIDSNEYTINFLVYQLPKHCQNPLNRQWKKTTKFLSVSCKNFIN